MMGWPSRTYAERPGVLLVVMTNFQVADRITTVPSRSPQTAWQWVRLMGNMVNLTTPIGLLVAVVGGARIKRGPRGLFVGEGYRLKFPVASAFTIGSVITTTRTWPELLRGNPQLFDHEERHTWQYLCCIGLPFYPAYGLAWSGRCCAPATGRHGTSSSGTPAWPAAATATSRSGRSVRTSGR